MYANRVVKNQKNTCIICYNNTSSTLCTIWFMNVHSKFKVPFIFFYSIIDTKQCMIVPSCVNVCILLEFKKFDKSDKFEINEVQIRMCP